MFEGPESRRLRQRVTAPARKPQTRPEPGPLTPDLARRPPHGALGRPAQPHFIFQGTWRTGQTPALGKGHGGGGVRDTTRAPVRVDDVQAGAVAFALSFILSLKRWF